MNNSVDQGFCIIDEHGQEKEMLQEQTIKPIIITGTTTKTTTGRYNLRRRHNGKAVTAKNTPNPLSQILIDQEQDSCQNLDDMYTTLFEGCLIEPNEENEGQYILYTPENLELENLMQTGNTFYVDTVIDSYTFDSDLLDTFLQSGAKLVPVGTVQNHLDDINTETIHFEEEETENDSEEETENDSEEETENDSEEETENDSEEETENDSVVLSTILEGFTVKEYGRGYLLHPPSVDHEDAGTKYFFESWWMPSRNAWFFRSKYFDAMTNRGAVLE